MRIPFYLVLISSLAACSILPVYVDPVPSQDTARIRLVSQDGVSTYVVAYPNLEGHCIEKNNPGGQRLPINLTRIGYTKHVYKKIGMPYVDEHSKSLGTEYYVSSKDPMIFTVSSTVQNAYVSVACFSAFRYQFQAGKDYQITLFPDPKNCVVGLSDITNFKPGDKLEPIQPEPIIVKGSPAWDKHCKSSN